MPETALSQAAVYSARPTVRIGGQADARITELVMAMRVEEHEGGMSSLELRFSNLAPTSDGGAELAFDADSKLKLGAEIAIGACTVFLMVLIDSESAVLLALGYVGMLVAGIYASERVRRRLQAKPRLGAATVATAANEGEAAIN